jgi:hypothetical protein
LARRYRYWECCIGLPGELVQYIADSNRSQQVTYETFARHTDLEPLRQEEHPAMYRISCRDNWAISFWQSHLPSGGKIYYFDWSRIEHVFVGQDVDLEQEMALIKKEETPDWE